MPPERRRYRSTDLAENQQGSIRWQSLVWDFGLSRMICKQMLNVNSLISFVLYIWETVTQLVSILNSSMHMLTTPSVNSPTYSTTMKDGGRDHHKWYKEEKILILRSNGVTTVNANVRALWKSKTADILYLTIHTLFCLFFTDRHTNIQ